MKRFILIALSLSALFLTGCPQPQCEVGQTRCNGKTAEICDSGRQWSFRADCYFVNRNSPGDWTCQDGTCVTYEAE